MKNLLRQYQKLDLKAKELDIQKQELKEQIADEFRKQGIEKEETKFGTFTLFKKAVSWKYSDKIKEQEQKLKERKIDEQEQGVATPVEKEIMLYTPNK